MYNITFLSFLSSLFFLHVHCTCIIIILLFQGHPHLTGLDAVRFLVLDEADRMVEFGHYQELSWILERINGARGAGSGVKGAGAAGKGVGSGARGDASSFRQTFVFSATLTLPRRSAERKVKVRQRKNLSGQESVGRWSVYNTRGPLC